MDAVALAPFYSMGTAYGPQCCIVACKFTRRVGTSSYNVVMLVSAAAQYLGGRTLTAVVTLHRVRTVLQTVRRNSRRQETAGGDSRGSFLTYVRPQRRRATVSGC